MRLFILIFLATALAQSPISTGIRSTMSSLATSTLSPTEVSSIASTTTTTLESSTTLSDTSTSLSTTTVGPSNISSTSIGPSSSLSINTTVTISSIAPNATATTNSTTNDTRVDDFEDRYLDSDEDQVEPPAQFKADEQVTRLVYTANYDQNECRRLASSMASSSSYEMRRHWSEVSYRRKRSRVVRFCMPAVTNIHAYVHWVPPSGVDVSWYNRTALDKTIDLTQIKLAPLGFALSVERVVYWQPDDTVSFNTRDNLPYFMAWVRLVKQQLQGSVSWNNIYNRINAEYSKLHIFIVDRPGNSGEHISGFANFPGISRIQGSPDCVVIGVDTMVGNTGGPRDMSWSERQGTTLVHEIGHWLGLRHLHDRGCSGTDYVGETLQYPYVNGKANYSLSCPDRNGQRQAKGAGGVRERNLMSYSNGRTRDNGIFMQGQAARAAAGYWVRRRGLVGLGVNSSDVHVLKSCPVARPIRRHELHPNQVLIPRDLPTMSKRQVAAELSSFCNNKDLYVDNYSYGDLASEGLYNPSSPAVTNQPPAAPETSAKQAQAVGDEAGKSSFEQVKAAVDERVAAGGPVATESAKPIVPPTIVVPSAVPGVSSVGVRSGATQFVSVDWMDAFGGWLLYVACLGVLVL